MYQQQRPQGKSPINDAIRMLALVSAIAVTFFVTPQAYEASIEFVKNYTIENYGYGFVSVVPFFWGVCTILVTFFASSLAITLAIMFGQFWLIRR